MATVLPAQEALSDRDQNRGSKEKPSLPSPAVCHRVVLWLQLRLTESPTKVVCPTSGEQQHSSTPGPPKAVGGGQLRSPQLFPQGKKMSSGLPGAHIPAVTQGSLLPDGFLSDCLGPGPCHSKGFSKQVPKVSYIAFRT